jgi:hypothetical protein
MPRAYLGTGRFIGIALASALRLPVELLLLPEPQVSLLSGILLGIAAGLPAEAQEDFRVTGTSHAIAIGGQIQNQTHLTTPTVSRSQAAARLTPRQSPRRSSQPV